MLVLERHLPQREKEVLQLSFESTAAGQAKTASAVDEEAETDSAVDKEAERAVCRGRARRGHGSRGGKGRVHRGGGAAVCCDQRGAAEESVVCRGSVSYADEDREDADHLLRQTFSSAATPCVRPVARPH